MNSIYKMLPTELALRCEDGSCGTDPTWEDVLWHAEGMLDLCVPSEDFYEPHEKRKFAKQARHWIARAKENIRREWK